MAHKPGALRWAQGQSGSQNEQGHADGHGRQDAARSVGVIRHHCILAAH